MKIKLIAMKEFGNVRFHTEANMPEADMILRWMRRGTFSWEQVKEMRAMGWDVTYRQLGIRVDEEFLDAELVRKESK